MTFKVFIEQVRVPEMNNGTDPSLCVDALDQVKQAAGTAVIINVGGVGAGGTVSTGVDGGRPNLKIRVKDTVT